LSLNDLLGENRNNGDQNSNIGVLEIPMVLLCFYKKIQRELTHVEKNHIPSVT